MNLDSIHRLIAEAEIFQMQRSSLKAPFDTAVPASPLRETCPSHMPPSGLQSHTPQIACVRSHPSEWDFSEELRLRELEEAKARAALMEKTMRWWSDCTANWREKWSKVRAERNSAKEEGRQLRLKLEMTMKELSALKKKQRLSHEKDMLEVQVTQDLKCPTSSETFYVLKDQYQLGSQTREYLEINESSIKENTNSKEEGVIINPLRSDENMKLSLGCSDVFKHCSPGNSSVKSELRLQTINLPLEIEVPEMSTVQGALDEFKKILGKEREMRSSLEKELEQLESALSVWKWKYEELRERKATHLKEVNIFHGQQENEVEGLSGDVKEGSKCQSSQEREICELRAELERLQAENTLERSQREILETERQELEKENRRLKVQVRKMEELLDRRNKLSTSSQGPVLKTSQIELQEKNKAAAEPPETLRTSKSQEVLSYIMPAQSTSNHS
ncbi:PREDICTED: coiled-coil domain-containing protein 102B [Chrysochloris asiatica]|uniref:Coiled-coil domain-containing protein 102B n=1 Tax=Chrysochloris asiatica TaxID=185453 RepID=A0A9B0WHP5_CHRAS|nr:PREDICTED: coiled-coil domain-containing protein 102B [Chrysochloris asiatica]